MISQKAKENNFKPNIISSISNSRCNLIMLAVTYSIANAGEKKHKHTKLTYKHTHARAHIERMEWSPM